jgi:hypothetical protein
MNNIDKGGLDMIETSKTAPVNGAIGGRRVLQDVDKDGRRKIT